jgi:hypothetical protein
MAVQLTGYQGPRGFKAEQVYDKSGQMMQQAKQDAQYRQDAFASYKDQVQQLGADIAKNQENDLRALSSFSDTLSEFLVDYQKKQNDKQYKLGLAEVMNGNVEFPQQTIDQHNREVNTLQAAATADGEVANQIEDAEVSTSFRQESPAIRGWRAYGRAVGTAKKAALDTQGFLMGFMERTEKIVPTPDGLKSPAEIRTSGTPAEIDAALAIGQQEMFQKKGLYNINPVILAEEFAPTFQAAKSQTKANAIAEVAKNNRDTAVEDISNQLKVDVNKDNVTAQELSVSYQTNVNRLQSEGGLGKGNAAKIALAAQLEAIKALPPDEALRVLDELAKVPKSAKDPKMGTLGSLHITEFQETRAAILNKEEQIEARNLRADNAEVAKIIALRDKARREEKDPVKLAEIEEQTRMALKPYADRLNVDAMTALGDRILPEQEVAFNRAREDALAGKMTLDEINALPISEARKKELRNMASDRNRTQFESDYGSLVKQSTKAAIEAQDDQVVTFNDLGKPTKAPEVYNAYTQAVEDKLFAWREDYIRKNNGQPPSEDDLGRELEKIAKETYVQYYDVNTKEPKLLANAVITQTNAQGDVVYNATNLRPDQLNIRYSHPNVAILLSKNETQANLERFRDGQQLTGRVRDSRVTRGMDTKAFLKTQALHHGIDPTPYFSGERDRAEADSAAAAPLATSRYYNSEDTLQQLVQAERIARGKQRQAHYQQQRELTSKKVEAPADGMTAMPDTDILQLALNQGLSEKQAVIMTAIALAESAGKPGNHNFNEATGDESYGLWQINMLGALGPDRRSKLGLTDNMQLADPETNARAMAYVLKSGYNAWTVYRTGAYRQYLPAAYRALRALQTQQ